MPTAALPRTHWRWPSTAATRWALAPLLALRLALLAPLAPLLAQAQPLVATTPAVGSASPTASAERGRAWLLQRFETGCILCHQLPGLPTGGTLGPSLVQLNKRWSADALRSKIADARRFNPQTIMPPYRSTEGLVGVAPAYAGRPVLSEEALEDIVAYLMQEPVLQVPVTQEPHQPSPHRSATNPP